MKLKWLPHRHGARESEDQKATPEASLSKRREQVRRAQRTHRERKEAYTKALEMEVLQLRTNEANLMQETKRLYAGIERLKETLALHGIPEPWPDSHDVAFCSSAAEDSSDNAVVTIEGLRTERNIRVRKATSSPSTAAPTLHSQSHKAIRHEVGHVRSDKKNHRPSTDASGDHDDRSPSGRNSTSMRDLDLPSLGIEFVLTLESPCLPHMEDSVHNCSAPPGHALTASAPLLFRAPSGPVVETSGSSRWNVPNVGLDRLLDLSSHLRLEEEITPVQAWNYISRHPSFSGLGLQRLRELTSRLLKHVECHGFGAVIELATSSMVEGSAVHAGWTKAPFPEGVEEMGDGTDHLKEALAACRSLDGEGGREVPAGEAEGAAEHEPGDSPSTHCAREDEGEPVVGLGLYLA
ncbi:uncharacterized protein BKCO1_1800069 [Diplodia corticola]|uniref:BZIP domain-containing protein n=1 Tax=Diplodia corticola TaxID=236234 RepID=A0A1J9S6R4_9PEZI|nr:uncharacterized protein BKCO1_1800069 [Diplodia corticola]OJD35301.1 hypothetical protein BKCO1_1800069 [Diplodia corticola]